MKKIIFVTGTDTGVGKTLLTALLLFHLRKTGVRALAMKPFCSGGRGDVRLLQSLQPRELPDDEMNPFYFTQPLAPAVAAGNKNRRIELGDVVEKIRNLTRKCDVLIVEGAGGVMVPLGTDFMVVDVIAALNCKVIITSRNRLGTINHTLLTTQALRERSISAKSMVVTLMGVKKPDPSSKTNEKVLVKLLATTKVLSLPHLGKYVNRSSRIASGYGKTRNVLSKIVRELR